MYNHTVLFPAALIDVPRFSLNCQCWYCHARNHNTRKDSSHYLIYYDIPSLLPLYIFRIPEQFHSALTFLLPVQTATLK